LSPAPPIIPKESISVPFPELDHHPKADQEEDLSVGDAGDRLECSVERDDNNTFTTSTTTIEATYLILVSLQ
jgi:hypothetical protein